MKRSKWLLTSILLFLSILLGSQIGFAEDIELQVIVQKANVRAKPDLSSDIVTQVALGTVLISDMKESNWYRILLPPDENGVRRGAFIHNSVVELISKTKEPAPKTDVDTKKTEDKFSPPVKKDIATKTMTQSLEPVRTGKAWKPKLGLKLLGGGSFLFGRNDFNDFFEALNTYYPEKNAVYGNKEVVTGEYKPLTTSLGGGLEFFIDILPQLGISFGIGNILGKKQSTIHWSTDYYQYEEDDTMMQKISAIPLTLSFNFAMPFGDTLRIGIYSGFGYYIGKVTYESSYDYMETASDFKAYGTDTWTAKSSSIGFHGGLNLELMLTQTLALVLRGGGNIVSFSGLTGDYVWAYENSNGVQNGDTEKDLTMWFGEWKRIATGKWYADVWIRENRPEDSSSERNYEEGRVSLTGFGIQIGIKINFGK